MQYKKIMEFVLCMGLLFGMTSGCTSTPEQELREKEIFTGSFSADDTFVLSQKLYENNGKYINFWVNNTGDRSVTIKINGKDVREIAAGENGHISAKVGMLATYYDFMAVPSDGNGGTITFEYRIKQTDEE